MSMRKKRFGIYLLLSLIFVIGMSAQVVLDNWGQQDREGRNIDVGFQNHKKIIVPLHWVGNVPQKMNKPVSFGIPFGKGEVYSEDILQLTSTDNEKIPIDTWPLAYWPDGSIKWSGIAGVIPVGMKNPTSGDISIMLNSIEAAQCGHSFIYRGWDVQTSGNDLTHAILRGAVNQYGQCIPNYHYEDLHLLFELYSKRNLKNPACIVDTNHSNSNKKYAEQVRIAKEVLHSRRHSDDIRHLVKGLMIESYIEPGNHKIGEHCYGQSITDPCLGWDESEKLLYDIAEMAD